MTLPLFDPPQTVYARHRQECLDAAAAIAGLSDKDAGMALATGKADARHDGWSAQAYTFLAAYAGTHALFAGWQVVQDARDQHAVPDASGKAWGSVFLKAARNGIIEKAGYTTDPNRHANPIPLWRSRLTEEPR